MLTSHVVLACVLACSMEYATHFGCGTVQQAYTDGIEGGEPSRAEQISGALSKSVLQWQARSALASI